MHIYDNTLLTPS